MEYNSIVELVFQPRFICKTTCLWVLLCYANQSVVSGKDCLLYFWTKMQMKGLLQLVCTAKLALQKWLSIIPGYLYPILFSPTVTIKQTVNSVLFWFCIKPFGLGSLHCQFRKTCLTSHWNGWRVSPLSFLLSLLWDNQHQTTCEHCTVKAVFTLID